MLRLAIVKPRKSYVDLSLIEEEIGTLKERIKALLDIDKDNKGY
jgi:hypothetical protein